MKGHKNFTLYVLLYKYNTLSLSFLQLDEDNKWTVHADADPKVDSLQSSANDNEDRACR